MPYFLSETLQQHLDFLWHGMQIQLLQKQLLQEMRTKHPEAMYPAALCTLADLLEVLIQYATLLDSSSPVRQKF